MISYKMVARSCVEYCTSRWESFIRAGELEKVRQKFTK